mgnify:CR=1 FL=1
MEHYIEGQHTFFVLENLDTLRKNGRLSKVKALVASALKIKPVMGSTDDGNICQLDQARGMNRALIKLVEQVIEKPRTVRRRFLPSVTAIVRQEHRCSKRPLKRE